MKRVALFVGVNRYEDPEISPLEYAENDATELYALFKHRAGYDDVRHLLSPDSDTLLDTAKRMTCGLEPGDLFLFFFAGHGVEVEKRHLLLCPKARYDWLRYYQHTVPVDLLKDMTERSGVNRVFVLDACRTDLLRGVKSVTGGGLGGAAGLRDIAVSSGLKTGGGAFALLCSCDEGEQARELAELSHGVFAAGFLSVCEGTIREGSELSVSDEFLSRLGQEMLQASGMAAAQRPWLQTNGMIPSLLASRDVPMAEPVALASSFTSAAAPSHVKCPECGVRNREEETFECRVCKRDYLCKAHFVREKKCCEACAEEQAVAEIREQELRRLSPASSIASEQSLKAPSGREVILPVSNPQKDPTKGKCRTCGRDVDFSWKSCPACGGALKTRCVSCGQSVIGKYDFCTSCGAAVSETEAYRKLCKVLRRVIDKMGTELQKSWSGRRKFKKVMESHGNVAADGPPKVISEQLNRLYDALFDVMGEMVADNAIDGYASPEAQSMWDVMTDAMMEKSRSFIALRFQLEGKQRALLNLQNAIATSKDYVDTAEDWMKPAFKKSMRWAEQESERIKALPYD